MLKTRKICLVGDFAVGKTSLSRRFISNNFSDTYITTVGVKVETKILSLCDGESLKLVVWDIAGSNRLTTLKRTYLQGASGYLLVADATRPETIESALNLSKEIDSFLDKPPFIALINKMDLRHNFLANKDDLPSEAASLEWKYASALTGEGVEEAFQQLANLLE
jgi:small GTP-binding protein